MFALHESTRRLLGRGGFLLLCLLPTCGVGGWCLFTQTPAYQTWQRQIWQRQLAGVLGLSVAVDRVSYPRPAVTVLHGVTFVDPETDSTIAALRTIELTRNDRGWVWLASFAELRTAHVSQLLELLQTRGLRTFAADTPPVELLANVVTLRHGTTDETAPAETLNDFRLALRPLADGVEAIVEFRVAGLSMAQPAYFQVRRNRQLSPPATHWALNTHGTPLPNSLLAIAWPAAATLGAESKFDGLVEITTGGTTWDGTINARLTNIDLNRLVTDQFPHRLGGQAEIIFNKVVVERGSLLEAAGTVLSRDGTVSRSLLEACARPDATQLRLDPRVAEADQPLWRYKELSLGFRVDGESLSLKGLCTRTEQGVILSDNEGPLLKESLQNTVPAVALVRALAPQAELQVPASQETRRMINMLAIPKLKLRDATAHPYTPLRFGERR